MAELKGSNTEKNLQAAFAGESQAFQKYTFYAAAARKAGMNEIADYFEETAHNEDRKSVVQGKSVFACVDLGGRRIIKKKKKK